MTEAEKGDNPVPVSLNDWLFRLAGIPFFGFVIPNATGLFGTLGPGDLRYWLGYPYFIALAAFVWQGNRYLLFRTRRRFTWFDRPIEKLILLLLNNIFYTAPLTIAWLCGWYLWSGLPKIDWKTIEVVVLINVICVLFITHIYETVFLVKEKESEALRNEQLQRARVQAELEALQYQVDPHFMFNSLNTLSYLITEDPKAASRFTENLAEVYRYLLMQKDRSLVLLEDELEFTRRYTELLQLRFGEALTVQKDFNGSAVSAFLIPPTSLFMTIENAVKHNELDRRDPLCIDLRLSGNQLRIENRIKERIQRSPSTKIGLRNLDERFRILTGAGIEACARDGKFVVTLPLVELSHASA